MRDFLINLQKNPIADHVNFCDPYFMCWFEGLCIIDSVRFGRFSSYMHPARNAAYTPSGGVYRTQGKYGKALIISYGESVTVTPESNNQYVYISETFSGFSRLRSDGEELCTGPGDIIVYDFTRVQSIELSENCQRTIFGISKRFFCDLANIFLSTNFLIHEAVSPQIINNAEFRILWSHFTTMIFSLSPPRDSFEVFEETMLFHLINSTYADRREYPIIMHDLSCRLSRAVAFIEKNAGNHLSLQDIARAAFCSSRSLQRAFVQEFRQSPMQYLKKYRLKCLHDALKNAKPDDTVTEIAFRFGFSHMGQLSVDYKTIYAESPSQTLHRTR